MSAVSALLMLISKCKIKVSYAEFFGRITAFFFGHFELATINQQQQILRLSGGTQVEGRRTRCVLSPVNTDSASVLIEGLMKPPREGANVSCLFRRFPAAAAVRLPLFVTLRRRFPALCHRQLQRTPQLVAGVEGDPGPAALSRQPS